MMPVAVLELKPSTTAPHSLTCTLETVDGKEPDDNRAFYFFPSSSPLAVAIAYNDAEE